MSSPYEYPGLGMTLDVKATSITRLFCPDSRSGFTWGLGPSRSESSKAPPSWPHLTSPPLPLFSGNGSSERAEASTKGGTYTERPPMRTRGGSLPLFPPPPPRNFLYARVHRAGSRLEFRKSANCLRNWRAGARFRVLLSACSVSPGCRVLAWWSVTSKTGARLRPLLKVGEEPQVIWPPGFLCFSILSLPS